jgi:hypothetical protein
MKKFLIVICLVLVLISSKNVENDFTLLDYFSGEYSSYTDSAIGETSLNLGFCFEQSEVVDKNELIGEKVKLYNFEPIDALKKLKANIVKTEYLDSGLIVIYAYTNLINNSVDFEDKKVNLQIAQTDSVTVIGWPLILGSF